MTDLVCVMDRATSTSQSGSERWYLGHTLPHKERVAQSHLKRQGFKVFLPVIASMRHHARKTEPVRIPLFPRYLFIQLDLKRDRWRSINGTVGMAFLLTNKDEPYPVPLGFVEHMKEFFDSDGFLLSEAAPASVDEAPEATGQLGELMHRDGQERVENLLLIIGGG
jgi:transcriptional antiterminator RfaH